MAHKLFKALSETTNKQFGNIAPQLLTTWADNKVPRHESVLSESDSDYAMDTTVLSSYATSTCNSAVLEAADLVKLCSGSCTPHAMADHILHIQTDRI